jgi:uncharacterized protein (TIGR02246 family)
MLIPPVLLIAVACTQPGETATTTGPDVEAIRTWVEQCAAAYNTGDIEAALALYADDPLSMPPSDAVMNRQDTRAMLETFFGENDVQVTLQADEIVVAGDLGVLRLSYSESWTPRGEGEAGEQEGTWLVLLRKQPDGSWKLWRDMWSAVPPPATEAM